MLISAQNVIAFIKFTKSNKTCRLMPLKVPNTTEKLKKGELEYYDFNHTSILQSQTLIISSPSLTCYITSSQTRV